VWPSSRRRYLAIYSAKRRGKITRQPFSVNRPDSPKILQNEGPQAAGATGGLHEEVGVTAASFASFAAASIWLLISAPKSSISPVM
jgi:hypothetical protein